ncbi:CbiX/SirB N-terminal domain-containing protein [Rhodobacter sp.]
MAHGQPSDPDPAARALELLAQSVAALLPGWRIGAATLAEKGRLAAEAAGEPGLVFPLFMAGGWFAGAQIPARLQAAGAAGWRMLPPLGSLPELQQLTVDLARASGAARILLAAHGSFRSRAPAAVAVMLAGRIRDETGLAATAAFIEQAPRLEDAVGHGPDSACLPFFAMAGQHVEEDLPRALAKAGFEGRILPAVGLDPRVPVLIAEALRAG